MSIKLIKNTLLSMTIVSQSYRDRKPRLISHQCDINQKDSKSQRDKSTKILWLFLARTPEIHPKVKEIRKPVNYIV